MTTNLSLTDQWNATPTGPITGEPHTAANYCADLGQLTQNLTFLFNRLAKGLLGGSFKTFAAGAVNTGTEQITITGHGIAANSVVHYANVGGTAIALGGVTLQVNEAGFYGVPFYVNVVDANTITLAATSGGAALNISDAGSGTHYLWILPAASSTNNPLATIASASIAHAGGQTIPASSLYTILGAYLACRTGDVFTGNMQVHASTGDLTLLGTKRITYASRSITRYLAMNATTGSANWSRANTPRGAWQNTASGGTLDIHLEGLPSGNVLASIGLKWDGAAGHGALPTMPSIELWRIAGDGTETSLGSATDASVDVAAYELAHEITISGLAVVLDTTQYRYVLTVTGETGGNFVANAKALAVLASFTVTTQPEV